MATNSKREQILVAVEGKLRTIPSIVLVKRTRPEFAELENASSTQLPMIAIVAGLPEPVQKKTGRGSGGHPSDYYRSILTVEVFCYDNGGTDPDSRISDLADDIWANLMGMGNLNNLIHNIEMTPDMAVGYWDPYITFKMTTKITYIHSIFSI
jgi:hypothetical protein